MARKGRLKSKPLTDEISRPFRPRRYAYFMLIVCEDEKTEPAYFRQFKKEFPDETVYLKEIGTGKKPKGIVEQTILERAALEQVARKEIDEVWVVFDKDDEGNNATTLANFNFAWKKAKEEKIQIAFSNETFELWLLLHFIEINAKKPWPRVELYSKLGHAISSFKSHEAFVYNHKKPDANVVINSVKHLGSQQKAIERAEKLIASQSGVPPIKANPITTVHLLVKRLRELIEYYNYVPLL